MKLILKIQGNIYHLMRRCGYHLERKDQKTGELVFVRRVGAGDYPRFHIYLKIDEVSHETQINLHLDQKKPVYEGAPAHGAEYSGEIVEKEAERIKQILGQ